MKANSEAAMKKKVIFLGGPTASGKSALALKIAQEHDGVVINADSMQVYDSLRVITARPSIEDEAQAPHILYGYRPPSPACSAAEWAADAKAAIKSAWNDNKLPVVVGGTGLYFRTLIEGISPIPDIPDDVRSAIRRDMEQDGPEAMHKRLSERDPEIAARLNIGDRQRVARALEVEAATGRPLSAWQKERNVGGLVSQEGFTPRSFALLPPREVLYARCDLRLKLMMTEQNGMDEIRAIAARDLDPELPVMKALGVPEFLRYLREETDFETALRDGQTATRQYAKRQMTWFRNQFPDWISGDAQYLESLLDQI